MTVYGITSSNANDAIRCQTWDEVEAAKRELKHWTRVTGWLGELIERNVA